MSAVSCNEACLELLGATLFFVARVCSDTHLIRIRKTPWLILLLSMPLSHVAVSMQTQLRRLPIKVLIRLSSLPLKRLMWMP